MLGYLIAAPAPWSSSSWVSMRSASSSTRRASSLLGVVSRLGGVRRHLGSVHWHDSGGLLGIETRLALLYQQVISGRMSQGQWVDVCCTALAKLFGLCPAKGHISPGADADIVIFDPSETRPLLPERLHMNVHYSP